MEDQLAELKKLEQRRSDLLAKIKMVEEKKDTVKPQVYEKVKKEYEAKLEEVNHELLNKRELVEHKLKTVETEKKEFALKKEEIDMELEELELRYSIGEYDEETFKRRERELHHKLAEVEKGLRSIEEQTGWMKELLQMRTEAAEEGGPDITTEKVEEAPRVEEKTESPEKAVVTEAPKKEDKFKFEDFFAELKGGVEKAKEEVKEESKEETTDKVKAEDQAKDFGMLDIEEHIFTKKEAFREQPKKIVCPKCGFANNPDSWYCEKCGAEILQESGQ
ncbi:MAG: hypothetical protein ABIL05_02915 [candidate division WOR-3 bacterium]